MKGFDVLEHKDNEKPARFKSLCDKTKEVCINYLTNATSTPDQQWNQFCEYLGMQCSWDHSRLLIG